MNLSNKALEMANNWLKTMTDNAYCETSDCNPIIRACVEALDSKNKEIVELEKKRSKGEINDAYAKTIKRQAILLSKMSMKVNKLEQKTGKLENELQKYRARSKNLAEACGNAAKTIREIYEEDGTDGSQPQVRKLEYLAKLEGESE